MPGEPSPASSAVSDRSSTTSSLEILEKRLNERGERLAAKVDRLAAAERGDHTRRQRGKRILIGIDVDRVQVLRGHHDGEEEELQTRGRERPPAAGVLRVEETVETDPARHHLPQDDGGKTQDQGAAGEERQLGEKSHVGFPSRTLL